MLICLVSKLNNVVSICSLAEPELTVLYRNFSQRPSFAIGSSLAEQTSDTDFYLHEILVLASRREAERWNKPDIFLPACVLLFGKASHPLPYTGWKPEYTEPENNPPCLDRAGRSNSDKNGESRVV